MDYLGFSRDADFVMNGNISRRDATHAIEYFTASAEENDLTVFFIMSRVETGIDA